MEYAMHKEFLIFCALNYYKQIHEYTCVSLSWSMTATEISCSDHKVTGLKAKPIQTYKHGLNILKHVKSCYRNKTPLILTIS